jgi:hypothetical protein
MHTFGKYIKHHHNYDTVNKAWQDIFNKLLDATRFDEISIFDKQGLTDLLNQKGIKAYK